MALTRGSAVVCGLVFLSLAGCGAESSADAAEAPDTAAALAAGAVPVYEDALASGWADWSWGNTRNYAATSPVAAGTRSLAVTYQAWGGLSLHRTTGSISGASALVLSVYASAAAGDLQVFVTKAGSALPGAMLAQYCAAKAFPVGGWTRCSVPMSALAPAGTAIDGFGLRELSGAARPTLYFDDIGLLPAAPPAPTGLVAAVSGGAVSLSWAAAARATGYDVYRSTAAAGPFTRLTASTSAATSYVDRGVVSGTTYWYQVTASNAGGTSARSVTVSAAVAGAPAVPAAPAGLVATPSTGKVSLSWGAVAGATGYEVSRATAVSGPFSKLTATAQAGTTYADTAVVAGTTYWYQVRAVNAAGASAPSASVSAAVPAPVTVTVSPASAALDGCRTTRFTAQVTGSSDLGVTWSVQEGAAGGTIDATGTYTAPNAAGTYHVVATSRASGTAVARATVVVQERVLSVAVTPGSAGVAPGAAVQFAATVTTTCGTFAAL